MGKTKNYFTDIIACVKFDDFYCFFSFQELYENKSFTSTKFIYDNLSRTKFGPELEEALTKNEFIGLGDMLTHDVIVLKKSIYNFFQFQYFEPNIFENIFTSSSSYRRTTAGIFRYLNGKDTSLGSSNFLDDSKFSTANTYGNPKNIFFMRVLENNFIYPEDVKNFASSAASVSSKNFGELGLKITDLPRIVDFDLLNIIFSQVGARQMSAGQLCYNLTYFRGKVYLEKNIDTNEENIITTINQNSFLGTDLKCIPDYFRIGDEVIGVMDQGSFIPLDRNYLLKLENSEQGYFRSYLENYSDEKDLEYPKRTFYLLVTRYRPEYPYDEKFYEYTMFTNGFYNLVSFYKPASRQGNANIPYYSIFSSKADLNSLSYFRVKVIEEFLQYIDNNFIKNGILDETYYPNKNKIIECLNFIQDSISLGSKIVTSAEQIDKEYFIYVITSLTNISDPNDSLVKFFSSPGIVYGDYMDVEYPYLRSIAFFVTCDKENACDSLTGPDEKDLTNITFPVLIDQRFYRGDNKTFSVYYNTVLETFVNYRY